jgi:hypothetical protein
LSSGRLAYTMKHAAWTVCATIDRLS